jgi:hypothetical protein
VVVSKPEPEGPEPPADAKKALMDMGASFKVSSTVKEWWVGWKNPRLDAKYGAANSYEDRKDKKPFWVEIDFQ